MNTKYSLTTLLNNLLKLQNNSYQIITKLSDIVSSNADTVEVDVMDESGTIQKVYVPSFGSLKNQMVTMDQNLKNLAGIGSSNSSVQLSDGTFRKILVSSLEKEAEDIRSMSVPKEFYKKENWFFESFLNPLLYVKFNLTGQIRNDTEKIEVSRYILNLDTPVKLKIFNDKFNQNSNIKFNEFSQTLLDAGITYFLDKETLDLPPRSLRFFGNFTVMNVFDSTETVTINGVNVQERSLRVQLDKLIYNDNQSQFEGTQQLKIGDSLVVNSNRRNTRYLITGIDSSTRTISLRLIEGFDLIKIGKDVLSFYGEDKAEIVADINIGFNEYCVIFIKPIDPDSRIQSVNWSPGVGIYTSNLNIIDPISGQTTSLSTFYQNEVVDFGAFLYSSVKDKTPPSIFGIVPDSPLLEAGNFKVVPINEHLTSSGSIKKLQQLQVDKQRVQSTVDSLDRAISELRSKIQVTRYTSQKLQDIDENSLSKLVNDRNIQSSLYSSIIDDINKIGTSESIENLVPKYRVRGFFPIPSPKTSDRTNPQEVVQFIVQYRYVKKDGSAVQPQQIDFKDNDGEIRRGTFSSWNEYRTEVRKRRIDANTGIAYWATDSVENADIVNINQVDFPIQQGEGVEFRVKSLSEAGWPVTPLESNWSNSIQIDFPSEFESIPNPNSIVEQAKKEQVKVEFQSEISKMQLDKIANYSITQGGKFYTADSTHIASGFLTPENNIITLFDKLNSIDEELRNLRSLIANAKGSISVKIVDEDGQEITVERNSTVKIFAGNYREQVSSLPIKKGVIITKTYFVKIGNEAASILELYSRIYGSRFIQVPSKLENDEDYNIQRRYDLVPIGLSNPDIQDVSTYNFIRNASEQSSQVRGQFINSRYRSVDGSVELYGSPEEYEYRLKIDDDGQVLVTPEEINLPTDSKFVWNFKYPIGYLNPSIINSSEGNLENLWIHTNHPSINGEFKSESIILEGNSPVFIPNGEELLKIRNNKFANTSKGSNEFYKQNELLINERLNGKIGFDINDQYLLGPKSVGAYLFLNPQSHKDLIVDGSDSISLKSIKFGNANSISIPITFQYRMTDYYGEGDSGLGKIGGNPNANPNDNLEYTKIIGIDIYFNPTDKTRFSFDLEITARYYSKSLITKDIPSRSFESAIDELTNTVKVITPRTSRDNILNQGS